MKDILAISTSATVMKLLQKIAREEALDRIRLVKFANLTDIIYFINHRLPKDVEVLVTTPGPSVYLSTIVGTTLPIVAIEYDPVDVIAAIREAWSIAPGRVALAHYQRFYPRTDDIKSILNIDFKGFVFGDDDEKNLDILRTAAEGGIDVVVGGGYICGLARQHGLAAIPFRLNEGTIDKALRHAISLADSQRITRRTQSQFDIILENQAEAVVAVNQKNIVTFCNKSAGQMFSLHGKRIVGQNADNVLPGNEFVTVLQSKLPRDNYPCTVKGIDVVGSYIPVFDQTDVVGLVGTFTTMRDIQKKDEYVRKFYYSKTDTAKHHFTDFYANGPFFRELLEQARHFAMTDETILITGESGTGKEVMAGSIHNASPRAAKPFIAINCAAIPATLMESELFGYEPGSFTGGKKNGRPGMFEFAHGGTLFLDEIGEMPLDMQSKVLRAIQEKEVRRLGASRSVPVDVRIVAATNRNLPEEIARKRFRVDLYYRLNVLALHIPPLRDYPDALGGIAASMLARIVPGVDEKRVSELSALLSFHEHYDWPGNLRELENVVRRFAVLSTCLDRPVTYRDIFDGRFPIHEDSGAEESISSEISLKNIRAGNAKKILDALYETRGNRNAAAQKLGISRSTLWRKLKKLEGIDR